MCIRDRAEGVRILYLALPLAVTVREGRVAGLRCTAGFLEPKAVNGRRPSCGVAGAEFTLDCQMVLCAVGQHPDGEVMEAAGVETLENGTAVADEQTCATSAAGIFAAGDAAGRPGSVVEAIADGHRVAEVVARFLGTGQAVAPALDDVEPLAPFPPDVVERLRTLTPAATEAQPFDEAEPSLAEREAVAEADRCLGCLAGAVIDETKCATCLTCLRVCPLDAIEIREDIVANPARCQACGVCASHCPAGAIELSYGGLAPSGEARWAAAQAGAAEPAIVRCRHRTNGLDAEGRVLTLPCLARLKPIELLRLFRDGARHVELHACAEEDCKYGGAWQSIEAVAGYVRNVLRTVLPEATLTVRLPDEQATPAEAADSAEAATLPREGGPAGGPA